MLFDSTNVDLSGQVAIVTGGGRGIGRAIAQALSAAKAKVAVARQLLVRTYIMLRDEIDYAEFVRRGVAVRSARVSYRPQVPGKID